jgi:hypothetical protein
MADDTATPEQYATAIEEFATDLVDDERASFTFEEADGLAETLKCTTAKVIRDLRAYGLTYQGRPNEKRVRGFSSNPHDRWYGPGSSRTHGGSGWEQINGFGGQKG